MSADHNSQGHTSERPVAVAGRRGLLSRINTLLVVVIVLVNAFTLLLPLWPTVSLWFGQRMTNTADTLREELHAPPATQSLPAENRLIIPDILFDQEIHEGKDARTLRDGLWRRPRTSTPADGGNTVITGHRFTYNNPQGTFYHLDKLKVGSELGVYWEGKKYLYTVIETMTVPASAVHVEAQTGGDRLTLYTCTPLWNPTDRLVVVAEPKEARDEY